MDLPGIDTDMLTAIARDTDEDYEDIWPTIYKRSWKNMVSDVSKNIQDKFLLNLQLVNRETSKFLDDANGNSGLAGIKIGMLLPRYAKTHVISISVYSQAIYASAPIFTVYDTDEDGDVLGTITTALVVGKNTINVDTDYDTDNIFIAYNPAIYTLRQTENRYFNTGYWDFSPIICDMCLWDDYHGTFEQVNGGGINVKYNIYCSIEKFVCENINLFDQTLLYKIGHEITVERRLGERLNKFTVMIEERWVELEAFYKAQYETNLMNVVRGKNILEDMVCFTCNKTVGQSYQLP
jgi:hypothetical protein